MLAEILHFNQRMVGLLLMMILALGAAALAAPTGATTPGLVLIGTVLKSS